MVEKIRIEGIAKTSWRGGSRVADVVMYQSRGKWIVAIDGTPGQWFLDTLTSTPGWETSTSTYIDFGQGWMLDNTAEVIAAAIRAVQ